MADFEATAMVLGEAPFDSHAEFDPFGTLEDFSFDVRVLKIEAVRLERLLRVAWEALASGVMAIFKNHPTDQFATRIPISGSLKDPELKRRGALVAILHSAMVEAFKPQLEKWARS